MVINEDKSIGTVIFIVEGQQFEFSIIDRIFTRIFHYEYHEKRRGKSKYLNKGKNPLSRVFVMNAESSNLNSISNEAYLDTLYEELSREFGINIDDAAIFFIFDRDPISNTKNNSDSDEDKYAKLHAYYANPWENDDNRIGGQLLLSYPSLESYEISNFEDDSHLLEYGLGSELKTFIGKEEHRNIQLNKMSLETIAHATKEFIDFINEQNISVDIDDLSNIPLEVYNFEEKFYEQHSKYRVLSLLTIAFIQLGMIKLDDDDVKNYIVHEI